MTLMEIIEEKKMKLNLKDWPCMVGRRWKDVLGPRTPDVSHGIWHQRNTWKH